MKCDEVLEYIYLGRENIIEKKKKNEFDEHISSCIKCQSELSAASKYFEILPNLQRNELTVEERESITNNVLGAINNFSPSQNSKTETTGWNIFYLHSFRYSAVLILLLISLFYFSEEITSYQKIRQLENKFGLVSANRFNQIKYSSVGSAILNPATEIYSLVHKETNIFKLPGDWILIRESEIIQRMQEYRYSPGSRNSAINYEEELKKFFSDPKIQKLMENNEQIKHLFSRVFPEGVGNHE